MGGTLDRPPVGIEEEAKRWRDELEPGERDVGDGRRGLGGWVKKMLGGEARRGALRPLRCERRVLLLWHRLTGGPGSGSTRGVLLTSVNPGGMRDHTGGMV